LIRLGRFAPTQHVVLELGEFFFAALLEVVEALPVVRRIDTRRVDHHDVLERDLVRGIVDLEEVEALPHLADLLELGLVVDDDQLDAGIDVRVSDLFRMQGGIDRDGLQPNREAGEVTRQPVLGGLTEQPDDVVILELGRGQDSSGDVVGPRREVFPRTVFPRSAVIEANGRVVRVGFRAGVEELGEGLDFERHERGGQGTAKTESERPCVLER